MKPKLTSVLSEAIAGYKKLSNPQDEATDEVDLDVPADDEVDLDAEGGDNEVDLDLDGEDDTGIMADIGDEAEADPDRQGLIRTVPKAHLIYKREQNDGTFEELWIYNIGDIRNDMATKKAILAGTDIPTNRTRSEDGEQECSVWSVGNAELLLIKGLSN